MNTFSHAMFGRLLHQYISQRCGVRLSRSSFIYGNMLPDFAPSFKRLPHERDYWTRFLKSEIAKLSGSKQEEARSGVNYSKRLGIICHFYADFFCYPHTEGFEGGALQHVRYELALHRHLSRSCPGLDDITLNEADAGDREAAEIFSDFQKLYREYTALPPSYEKDIIFTLRACAGLLAAVTANSRVGDPVDEAFVGLPLTACDLIVGAENSI